jgi:glycosyltransferase involved in cell wall biosynthesis
VKIAFVYAGGREARWEDALAGRLPSDFFYGAVELARAGHEVVCVDAPEARDSWVAAGYNMLLGSRTPARTRGEHLVGVSRILGRLRNMDAIVAASTSHANALARWKRRGRLHPRLVGIHCGHVNFDLAPARQRATARALASQDVVLFAESERGETLRQFGTEPRRVHTASFGVDVDFWTSAADAREFILSVGNDGRRDYATLVNALAEVDVPAKIVTARPLPPLPAHVEHLRGSWHAPAVTDEELRDLYRRALVTVVPLEDAIQPSGQSVALQALACGSPVVLTRTRGWWGGDDFSNCLTLVEPRSPDSLLAAIRGVLAQDSTTRETMTAAAREAVLAHGRIDTFAARLADVLASPSIS